jgi:chemotaxis response regulator CheB
MPKEAVKLGAVDRVLTLTDISSAILGKISRKG